MKAKAMRARRRRPAIEESVTISNTFLGTGKEWKNEFSAILATTVLGLYGDGDCDEREEDGDIYGGNATACGCIMWRWRSFVMY